MRGSEMFAAQGFCSDFREGLGCFCTRIAKFFFRDRVCPYRTTHVHEPPNSLAETAAGKEALASPWAVPAILTRRKARATTAINGWLPVASHIRAENMCTRATTRIKPWDHTSSVHQQLAVTSPCLVTKWLQDDVPVPRLDASQVRGDPRVHHVPPATWKICTPMPWAHWRYSCPAYHGNVRTGNEYDAHPVDHEDFSVGFYCTSLGKSCPALLPTMTQYNSTV